MPTNDNGEFELVVGNRWLLGLVFVLMVLFGIFFSLGYFVGRNSAPEQSQANAATNPTSHGGVNQPQERPSAPEPEPTADEPPVEGQPTESPQAAPDSEPDTGQVAETPPPAPVAPMPKPGIYLQVVAVQRREADAIVDVLRKKGFSALVAPVVIDGQVSDALFRALVGPVRDANDLAKTRAALEAAGFKPIIRKY